MFPTGLRRTRKTFPGKLGEKDIPNRESSAHKCRKEGKFGVLKKVQAIQCTDRIRVGADEAEVVIKCGLSEPTLDTEIHPSSS
jgi:hypothetical protein